MFSCDYILHFYLTHSFAIGFELPIDCFFLLLHCSEFVVFAPLATFEIHCLTVIFIHFPFLPSNSCRFLRWQICFSQTDRRPRSIDRFVIQRMFSHASGFFYLFRPLPLCIRLKFEALAGWLFIIQLNLRTNKQTHSGQWHCPINSFLFGWLWMKIRENILLISKFFIQDFWPDRFYCLPGPDLFFLSSLCKYSKSLPHHFVFFHIQNSGLSNWPFSLPRILFSETTTQPIQLSIRFAKIVAFRRVGAIHFCFFRLNHSGQMFANTWLFRAPFINCLSTISTVLAILSYTFW